MKRKVFKNGLVAIADPIPGQKRTALYIGVRAGLPNEPKDKIGLTHFLEHMVDGSNEYFSKSRLGELLEYSGIDTNAATFKGHTILEYEMPGEMLPRCIEIALKMVKAKKYRVDEFKNEKGVILSEMNERDDTPDTFFYDRRVLPRLLRGTALAPAVLGTLSTLRNITLKDLVDYKTKHYVPNNMVVVACGNVKEDFFKEIGKTFGRLPSKQTSHKKIDWQFEPGIERVKVPNSDSSLVTLAYRAPRPTSAEGVIFDFISDMLANGITSLLYKNLRNIGIGYTPDSNYECDVGCAYLTMESTSIKKSNIAEAVKTMNATVKQLRSLKDRKYFEGRKSFTRAEFLKQLEDLDERATQRVLAEFNEYGYDIAREPDILKKLTLKKFREVANKYLSGKPLIVIGTPKR